MNIIFVNHYTGKDYCFEVPEPLLPYLKKGMTVLVETKKGVTTGITTTDIISGDGARDIAVKAGAYFPLAKVISFLNGVLMQVAKNQIINVINEEFEIPYIPF